MKNLSIYLSIYLSVCCMNANSQIVEQFQKFYGGSDYEDFRSMIKTTDGGFLFAGNTVSYGAGLYDVYLVKTDANGDSIWTKIYGGANYDIVWTTNCLQQTTDGGYILVAENRNVGGGDFWLLKLNTYGDTLWTKTYGGYSNERPNCLRQTSDGGYIIAGQSWSYGNANDVYIVKADSIGNMQWQQNYSLRTYEDANGIVETPEGDYILAGITYGGSAFWRMKINSSGDVIWYKDELYGGSSGVINSSDNNYMILGNTWVAGNGQDVYLIKINTDGDTLYTKTYGGINLDSGNHISLTSEGGYLISGTTESFGAGGSDAYLIKTNENCDTLWTKTMGTYLWQRGYASVETDDGGYIICGSWDIGGNAQSSIIKLKELVSPTIVTGKIYSDVDSNCVYTHGIDNIIVNRMVKAEPGPYYVFTNDSGDYKLLLPKGDYTVSMNKIQDDPWGYQNCMTDTVYQVHAVGKGEEIGGNDFGLKLTTVVVGDCFYITSDITFIPPPKGSCAPPAQQTAPCPGDRHQYCYTITNEGLSDEPIPIGTILTINVDAAQQILSVVPNANFTFNPTDLPSNTLNLTLINNINIGDNVEVCVRVETSIELFPLTNYVTNSVLNIVDNGVPHFNELILNGDFEQGNIGFNSEYINGCGVSGSYEIGVGGLPTFTDCNLSWWGVNHTIAGINFLYADGSNVPNESVWETTITGLIIGENYNFDVWFSDISNFNEEPSLQVFINNNLVCQVNNIHYAVGNEWVNCTSNWIADNTTANIRIIAPDLNSGNGNDFGIDDISFTGTVVCGGNIRDELRLAVDCPCDPNDKLVSPKGCGESNNIGMNEELEYTIRFQNVGGSPAHNVIIKDSLDSDFDLITLRVISTSHDITNIEILPNNLLQISYIGIELPDSLSDEEGSHGYIIFKIKPKNNLADGTQINNQAAIYFDNNPAVITNFVSNTLRENPTPDASFDYSRTSCNTTNGFNFNYTGNTADNAEFYWNFGSNATPQYSTLQNPTNIIFNDYNVNTVTLIVTRFGCSETVIDTLRAENPICGNKKVQVCHNGNTICISENALQTHLSHGDCLGSCYLNKKSGSIEKDKLVIKTDIFEAFPNPFENSTKIKFSINENTVAQLNVYNYLGENVATLFNNEIIAGELYSFDYKTNTLPSGIYYAILKTELINKKIKLIVIR